MKVLVLGAYGNFGSRICHRLAPLGGLTLLLGGRDPGRGRQLAERLAGDASAVAIDLQAPDLPGRIASLAPDLVIHAAGPYQAQGYQVARSAARAGAHYIDLSDGRRFVCDFPEALDDEFRRAGRTGVAGASTVPALSSAVIDHLLAQAPGLQAIDSIDICIAPAQGAPRGVATMQAVLGYCGAPIQVWTQGRWRALHGWAHPHPVRFARLRPRLGALCDIPDLELFPQRYAVRDRVMFRAALELRFSQHVFAALAAARRRGWMADPSRWAAALERMAKPLDRLGTALGGMVVRVAGTDAAGVPRQRAWHVAADDNHGPEIPCMAAIVLTRRLLAGEVPAPGAVTAAGLLRLDEFAPEFAHWGMQCDTLLDEGAAA